MLRALAPDVWVATHKLRFYGTPVVTRMTVVRLGNGELLVHGPVPRSAEIAGEVDPLGAVRWVIAPNRFHHLYAGEWASLPGARLLGAPGVARKRPDLRLEELGAATPAGWPAEIEHVLLEGLPIVNEVVLFHRPSRTLIVADLFFNYRPAKSLFVRLVRLIEDCDGKFVVPRFLRLLVRDRAALRRSLDCVLAWDFERVVMAHGDVLEDGGKARARQALAALGA